MRRCFSSPWLRFRHKAEKRRVSVTSCMGNGSMSTIYRGTLFVPITDRPQVVGAIFNDYGLDRPDHVCHLRLRLKMQRYAFTEKWIPKKENTDTVALSRSLVSTADELSDRLLSVPAKVALLCSIAGSDNKVIDLTKDSGKRQTDLDNRPRGGQVIEDDFKQLLER
ncbi:hypothetical protein T4C_9050 [Trichinella pseudospiralis]|uniref:Uncharacterized protein n=1 Tax=Trichinella pseudospiralis TaxID=6337 RepID=A0A0V1JJY3_TRIPS|nr:hypothetical protein T4C_9050 [Trichinella pseudospiralis]